jgi:serine/threonine-protein kinase
MVEREVAIKALRPEIAREPETLERFHREAVTLAKLNHPAIAQLYTFLREGDDFFMVMEYVPGRTLETVIHEDGRMPWQRAASIAASVADAIAFAHGLDILHRDLKPANIMLTPDGRVKVMDFGIAQVLGGRKMTREGKVVGTVEYLAPERIRGNPPDQRSDIYSLGLVLYEMLTGRLPFECASEYEMIMAQLNRRPPAPAELGVELPPAFVEAVMTAVEKDPKNRYPDAASFAAALRKLSPTPEVPASVEGAMTPRPPAGMVRWLVAGVAVFLLAVLVSIFLFSRSPEEDPWKEARTLEPVQPDPVPAVTPPVPFDPTPFPVNPAPPIQKPAEVPKPAQVKPAPIKRQPLPPPPPEPKQEAPAPAQPESQPPVSEPLAPVEPPKPPPVRTIASIHEVRRLFVERAEGGLDSYLRSELRDKLGDRIRLAESSADAEAVLEVSVEQLKGGSLSRAGRMFGLSDKRRVQARILDPSGGRVLWEDTAGDRQPITGSFKGDGLKRMASRIVSALEDDLR